VSNEHLERPKNQAQGFFGWNLYSTASCGVLNPKDPIKIRDFNVSLLF